MKRYLSAISVLAAVAICQPAHAQDAEECLSPRLSDVGWTDISAVTAVTASILEEMGYTPEISILSVAVTFESLKSGNVDIFLGNWMPLQEPMQVPLVEAGEIEVVRTNLEGALIGLAVPTKAFDAGLRTYADIAAFKDQLGGQIYGIEPGSGANATILSMIEGDKFGLGEFELVESSEQGMLSQVQRIAQGDGNIVFFGWRPHPMNVRFDMEFLTDGDDVFGPQDGTASVLTNTRAGYSTDCPNVGKLLSNLAFTVPAEDVMMSYILDEGLDPQAAAKRWLSENPDALVPWLDGVKTADGQDALGVVQAAFAP